MDGDGLRKRAEALLGVCNERFTSGDKAPQFAVLQMQSLDERMQRIEQLLSKQAA
jgi:hypothetical protein